MDLDSFARLFSYPSKGEGGKSDGTAEVSIRFPPAGVSGRNNCLLPILCFFDFAAASPSILHDFLLAILSLICTNLSADLTGTDTTLSSFEQNWVS